MPTRTERAAGLLSLTLGLLHWWLRPESGTDLAAQLARASFARAHPFTPVDFSWYGGVHPFGYSLLSPWLMGLLGVPLAGVAAAVVASVLLAHLLRDTHRPVLSAMVGAAFITLSVASGRTTFALGFAAGLGALCALPRRGRSVGLAVLTALLSPVAAAFLGFAAAVLVLHRRPGGWLVGLASMTPVVVLAALFGGGGVQPFSLRSALLPLVGAAVIAVLTTVPMVRTGAVLYGIALVLLLLVNDPFGSNVLRFALLLAATVLLATAARRPLLLALATSGLLAWQVAPAVGDVLLTKPTPSVMALKDELRAVGAARVEVVSGLDHRDAADLVDTVSLARGWARQQDVALNPLFYTDPLTGPDYVDWLREHAVDHVAVLRDGSLEMGSAREGELLRAGSVSGLREVWHDESWAVYAVAHPAPLVSAPMWVFAAQRDQVALVSDRAADVVLRVRWSRWLTVVGGDACIQELPDGQVWLRMHGPGTVVIGSSLQAQGHCSYSSTTTRSDTGW